MLVAGAGTGGTISGLGRKIKEKCPNCKVSLKREYGDSFNISIIVNLIVFEIIATKVCQAVHVQLNAILHDECRAHRKYMHIKYACIHASH